MALLKLFDLIVFVMGVGAAINATYWFVLWFRYFKKSTHPFPKALQYMIFGEAWSSIIVATFATFSLAGYHELLVGPLSATMRLTAFLVIITSTAHLGHVIDVIRQEVEANEDSYPE